MILKTPGQNTPMHLKAKTIQEGYGNCEVPPDPPKHPDKILHTPLCMSTQNIQR
jgi:hypothetical protein